VDDAGEFMRLLAGLRAGDPSAGDALCRQFAPVIRATVRRQLHPRLRDRFDSLDFVQDVWASFLAIPADRYAFESPEALLAFLTKVAHHKVVNVVRQRFGRGKDAISREERVEKGAGAERDPILSSLPTPSQWAVAGEEWQRILRRFPVGHRVIVERLREGYSHEDIARMANVSMSTVSRVVRRLKDLAEL